MSTMNYEDERRDFDKHRSEEPSAGHSHAATLDTDDIVKEKNISVTAIGASLIVLLCTGVVAWAINSVRVHEMILERHAIQIVNLKESVDEMRASLKDEFRDIKTELKKRP